LGGIKEGGGEAPKRGNTWGTKILAYGLAAGRKKTTYQEKKFKMAPPRFPQKLKIGTNRGRRENRPDVAAQNRASSKKDKGIKYIIRGVLGTGI